MVGRYAIALLLGAFACASHAADARSAQSRLCTALRRCVELIQQAGDDAAASVFTYRAQGTARGG